LLELGYDRENIYINDEDEQKCGGMRELERETFLELRRDKIAKVEKVYEVRAASELKQLQATKAQPVKESLYQDDGESSQSDREPDNEGNESDEYVPDAKKRDEKADRKARGIDKFRS
jgi:hypothetical protein